MIPPELEAKILRLFHAEKWPPGTIADHLNVHHSVVDRVVGRDGTPRPEVIRQSKLDPYVPFIRDTLRKHPRLHASRIFWMCRERGYDGSEGHLRRMVRKLRPKPEAEAFFRLKTFPGEQAQVDWGHFGRIEIGAAVRALVAFVMVLSYSRRIFLRFYLGQQTENFLRGHEAAFRKWGGCPRVVLYDNLKSCVLERVGDATRFNPLLVEFSTHYHFEPRPVAKARGNEKGRVERAIRYVRNNFFAGLRFKGLDDLNAEAEAWCDGRSMQRPWPDDDRQTVADAFEHERNKLLELPGDSFPVDERREVPVGKTPYVRFDKNDYSVPHDRVRRVLTVVATLSRVRIFDGTELVADHPRSFSRRERIEDPKHIDGLKEAKKRGRKHRGFHRLFDAAPSTEQVMKALGERGENLGAVTSRLLKLLDEFGAAALERATIQALENGVAHDHAIRQLLEQQRRQAGIKPKTPVDLPADPRIRGLSVRPHALDSYDQISRVDEEQEQEGSDDES
jgi:transposase